MIAHLYTGTCNASTESAMDAVRLSPVTFGCWSKGRGGGWNPLPLSQMGTSSAKMVAASRKPSSCPPQWKASPPRAGPSTTDTRAVAPNRLITRPRCATGIT